MSTVPKKAVEGLYHMGVADGEANLPLSRGERVYMEGYSDGRHNNRDEKLTRDRLTIDETESHELEASIKAKGLEGTREAHLMRMRFWARRDVQRGQKLRCWRLKAYVTAYIAALEIPMIKDIGREKFRLGREAALGGKRPDHEHSNHIAYELGYATAFRTNMPTYEEAMVEEFKKKGHGPIIEMFEGPQISLERTQPGILTGFLERRGDWVLTGCDTCERPGNWMNIPERYEDKVTLPPILCSDCLTADLPEDPTSSP